MLCRLQHQNIIRFIGVCHSPLCFVIEIAPLGSLQGILEKKQHERDQIPPPSESHLRDSILDRFITYKIAFQVGFEFSIPPVFPVKTTMSPNKG